MRKGKSRNRAARHDILRSNVKNAKHHAKVQTSKQYDRRRYDGHESDTAEEA